MRTEVDYSDDSANCASIRPPRISIILLMLSNIGDVIPWLFSNFFKASASSIALTATVFSYRFSAAFDALVSGTKLCQWRSITSFGLYLLPIFMAIFSESSA